MSARAAIVVQARMGSARLPGKSLSPIAGRSLLGARGRAPRTRGRSARRARDDDPARGRPALRRGRTARHRGAAGLGRRRARPLRLCGVGARRVGDHPGDGRQPGGGPRLAALRTLEILQRSGADYVVDYGLPVGAHGRSD